MAALTTVAHVDCTAAESPPWHTCDKGREGFADTFSCRVGIDLTAWRRGSAMMMDKKTGTKRHVTPPYLFSLLCQCPVKQGLSQEAVCEFERLYAKYYPGTEYSCCQFGSSKNCGKLYEGSDMFEFSLGRKGPEGYVPCSP